MEIEDIELLFKTESFIDEINCGGENIGVMFLQKHILKFYPNETIRDMREYIRIIFRIPRLQHFIKRSQIILKLNEMKKMKIETKYEVGQKVFYLEGTKLVEDTIHSIKIEVTKDKIEIKYWFFDENKITDRFQSRLEELVFFSKLQFLNQLSNQG